LNQSHNLERAGETPSYYAVIPASVLYDPRLSADAKILYAEITGLCRLKGFCWASNAYFAKIHGVCGRTILNWINTLRDAGHIILKFEYEPDSKEISRRLIYPSEVVKNASPPNARYERESQLENQPPMATPSEVVKNASPPTQENFEPQPDDENAPEVVKNPSLGGEAGFVGVVKNFSLGGEEFFAGTNKTINIKKATAASSEPEKQKNTEAAAVILTPEKIKEACIKIDNSLIFDRDFYDKAAAYMHSLGLDLPFLAWVYQYCAGKKPNSLRDYYFTVFFLESMAEAFIESIKPPAPHPKLREIKCPVCGEIHTAVKCPQCGITRDAGKEEIEFAVKLHVMPEDKRREYEKLRGEIGAQLSENNDFVVFHDGMIKLKRQFGLEDA
jgi:hypothetical protein